MEINCAKYPLICAVIPFGVGIILAKFILPFTIALFFSVLLFILYLIFYKSNKSIFILFLLLVCTGALRYQQVDEILPVNYLSRFSADSVHGVSGTIVKSQFAADDRNQYILDCDSVWLQDEKKSVQGRILLKTKKLRQRYFYGMRLIIRGRIELPPTERNPGQFDYRQYLAQNDISHLMLINSSDSIEILTTNDGNIFRSYLTEPVKTYCQKIFYNHLQQSSAAIMNALILGEKQNLDRTTIENFQQVGVVHVLAISGLHVGYVVLFVFTTLSFLRLSQKYRILVLAAILLIYIVLVNFKPPVMRASLMVLLYLWGKLIERKISTGNLIAASAFLILLYEPRELLNPGFQFSFSAVISIIYGFKRLSELIPLGSRLKNNKYLINIVWNPLLVSVSAVMGTLPLTLYYYGTFPVIAILANIVVIPLIGIIVLLGFFLLIISPISSGLADGIGLLIHFTYQVLDTITLIFSRIPFATLDLPIPDLILTLLIASRNRSVLFSETN